MDEHIETTLAQHTADSHVVETVHDIPPYRVYKVRLDGQQAVLKMDANERGHAADEGRAHEYVATQTTASVPAILAVGSDHYITAWHEEIAASSPRIEAAWARAAGRWMGTLHAETAGEFAGFGRLRDDGGLALDAHDEWVAAAIERVEYHRPHLQTSGHADVADAVVAFFEANPAVFDGAGGPVLCHGDIHPEHLRRTAEGSVAIDFEHALVAPAEYDYWRTVMPYLRANEDVDEAVTQVFREGYESVRSLPDGTESRSDAYRLVNLVAFLESLYLQRTTPQPRRDKLGERMRELVFETIDALG